MPSMTENIFKNKVIVLGLTGGIACYKICLLIRKLKSVGASIRLLATDNALNFITKTTLQSLAKTPLLTEQFFVPNFDPKHIALADEADLFILAPATANTISKIANAQADNLLTSVACAWSKPMLIAPAMNFGMWFNPSNQNNIAKLKKRGFIVLEPAKGLMASGAFGKGRLPEPEVIFDKASQILRARQNLKDKRILITCGGTKERIDDVRFISNFSSGKMGKALADMAHLRGAKVSLITTIDFDAPYQQIKVESAEEMRKVVLEEMPKNDCLFMASAVSDFRPKELYKGKLKKTENQEEITLTLIKNPDILAEVCKQKKANQKVIGFALESEDLSSYAKEKCAKKGCDYIVANKITALNSDENEVILFAKDGTQKEIKRASKEEISNQLLDEIFN